MSLKEVYDTPRMRKRFRRNIVFIIVMLPFIIFFIRNQKRVVEGINHVKREGVIDTALIFGEQYGYRSAFYFKYKFKVNGKEYKGNFQYSPSNGNVDIGDSILVKYNADDPEKNVVVEQEDYKLIKVNRTDARRFLDAYFDTLKRD